MNMAPSRDVHPPSVTNTDFLRSVFRGIKADETAWTCAFSASPSSGAATWCGAPLMGCPAPERGEMNAYFSVSAIRPDANGEVRRNLAHFSRLFAVVIDDADPETLPIPPTWVLETSRPNGHLNTQVGYRLACPVEDLTLASRVHAALSRAGHIPADRSGNNPVRYVRLPVGSNTKHDPPHLCRLVVWRPELAVSVEDFVRAFNLDLTPPATESRQVPQDFSSKTFFGKVNTLALADLSAWVPAIFPSAREYHGGYRVSSVDLERDLEEDLALVPEGIRDFGEEVGKTAIDVALQWGTVRTPAEAALWLCGRLGHDPATLGWRHAGPVEASNDPFAALEDHARPADNDEIIVGEEPRLLRLLIPPERFDAALQKAVGQPWLVYNWLPAGALAAMVGKPKSGKSFVAVDLACSIAAGLPEWFGYEIEPGRVLYIAAEGSRGLLVRVAAWRQQHGTHALSHLDILPTSVSLDNQERLAELAPILEAAIRKRDRYRLIVIDTLARSMDGDENSTPDMNRVIRACELLQRIGSTILLVHHHGKDVSRGARGSSALPGAVEVQIDVESGGDLLAAPIKVELTLAKDSARPPPLNLRARAVGLGMEDARGRPVGTLVLDPPAGRDIEADMRTDEEARQKEAAICDALVRLIAERHAQGERVHTATAGAFTAYSALRDDPHYPQEVGARRLAEMLRELEREGRIMVRQYRRSDRNVGTCWAPAEPEAQAA